MYVKKVNSKLKGEMKVIRDLTMSKRSSLLPDVLDDTELVLLRLAPPGEGTF